MASKTIYQCTECQKEYTNWVGFCKQCGNYSTVEEVQTYDVQDARDGLKTTAKLPTTAAKGISQVSRKVVRIETGIQELDRVLGGGFVKSEVALIGGEPGAGKSTISLMLANSFAEKDMSVLYLSSEESTEQIGLRADRMGIDNDNIKVVHSSSLEEILGYIQKEKPDLFIVDSLHTIASSELSGSLGSIQQSKESSHSLNRIAKEMGIRAFLVSQVNKDGEFAGSEVIQHVVDVSLFLESSRDSPLKFLRTYKNRFGSADEVGIFQHTENGLEEVNDPSGLLLDDDEGALSEGAAFGIISEGIRQVPVEVQALTTMSSLPNPRKQFNGVQYNRGQIICAILNKFCNLDLDQSDVFVSTVFGVKFADPLSDLAVAAAIISSENNSVLKKRTIFVGELSLTGQVRGVQQIESKIVEAERMGFEQIVIPSSAKNKIKGLSKKKIQVTFIKNIRELHNLFK